MLLFTALLAFATPNSTDLHTDDTNAPTNAAPANTNDSTTDASSTPGVWAPALGAAAAFTIASPVAFAASSAVAGGSIAVMGGGLKLRLPPALVVVAGIGAFLPAPILFALPLVVASMLGAGGAAWLAGDDVKSALVGGAIGGGVAAGLDFAVLLGAATYGAFTFTLQHRTDGAQEFGIAAAVAIIIAGPVADAITTPIVANHLVTE